MHIKRLAIIGTVGLPANYGGFETLVENLVQFHSGHSLPEHVTVYCSSKTYPDKPSTYLSAQLRYVALNANGVQSVLYDVLSLVSALWHRSDVILLLGVSGAMALPIVRLLSSARIITNIDGIEWRREKWQGVAKSFLRFSEKMAVRYSHAVIADNGAIAEYVKQTYGVNSHVIAYGGDHAVAVDAVAVDEYSLPKHYAFSVCRIEPENNVHVIVEVFSKLIAQPLVIVGNWDNSEYGRDVRARYSAFKHLFLLDSIYDIGKLKTLRSQATFYVHGHSAGGTNPSLVEAMHFGKAVLAFDCDYNRSTTENKALYFGTSTELQQTLLSMNQLDLDRVGVEMLEVAQRRYTWNIVAEQYFSLLTK
jgi:glycosyltransferase involved in cell wall biosynthesis